ncbi:uncharacterized protein LOC103630568 [Zea mays]|uniref:Uncharacterized protein n=1 Tax=Zea mays TaxID=4577 RepID=A0A804Q3A3_MAIZE|nr:uncharacterized protein LOC103630568 [Zea mays]
MAATSRLLPPVRFCFGAIDLYDGDSDGYDSSVAAGGAHLSPKRLWIPGVAEGCAEAGQDGRRSLGAAGAQGQQQRPRRALRSSLTHPDPVAPAQSPSFHDTSTRR